MGIDKKQEILDAAFEIFSEKGYHLSLSELAGAVKIKTPSLYSHFASKDEIIELVVRDEIQRYYRCLEEKLQLVQDAHCKEALQALFCFSLGYFSHDKRLRFWRAIPFIPNQQLNRLCSQLIQENDKQFNQQIQLCFAKGQQRGEIRSDLSSGSLHLYLCMIQGVLDGMLLYAKEPGDDSGAAEIFEAYWAGISPASVC